MLGEEHSRPCFHCKLYFPDIRKEHRKNAERVLNHLTEEFDLYYFEVHAETRMIDNEEIFYRNYPQLQDIIIIISMIATPQKLLCINRKVNSTRNKKISIPEMGKSEVDLQFIIFFIFYLFT
ncbi:MAG: hypothetical protein ACFFG0_51865 [Candidatus Thorarchaeota archaeon]